MPDFAVKTSSESPGHKKQLRFIVALTKAPITDITQTLNGQRIQLKLGGSTTMSFDVTNAADVRIGDILTLYTEVPIKES